MHAIDCIDAQLLKIGCAENSIAVLAGWADPLKLGCQRYSIDDAHQISALIAQAGHESSGFTDLMENLNYSAGGLARTWPSRYALDPHASAAAIVPNSLAYRLQRNPQAIANNVYANRMGNGDEASGDGWLNRGRGPFQITGADNLQKFATAMGITLEAARTYLESVNGGAMSACWYFYTHGLANLAETPGCADETKAVNGGELGLADRTRRFNLVMAEFGRRGFH